MSECKAKYEFRQPVEVLRDGRWIKGTVLALNGTDVMPVYVHARHPDGTQRSFWQMETHIRPDPDFALVPTATPRTGWRLPEPGDVVRVTMPHANHEEGVVRDWDLGKLNPVGVNFPEGGFARYQPADLELVRLHDAPQPEPAPDPTPPPRSNKQDIIDNATLELAAVALEQHGQDRIAAMVRDLQRDWSEAS